MAVAENLWRKSPTETVTDWRRAFPSVHSVDARPAASVSATLSLTVPLSASGVNAICTPAATVPPKSTTPTTNGSASVVPCNPT